MNVKISSLLLILIVDATIILLFDSIYCNKDFFAIAYAFLIQISIYLIYYESELISDIDFIMRWRNVPILIILLILSFGILRNGSLGMDTTGRTDNCPNTWLQYLSK